MPRSGGIRVSREQNRRQPLASIDRGLVGAAPRLEELHQLLARAVIVPLAIALDDFEQLVGCFGAVALGVERGREIESRLMVERVCGDCSSSVTGPTAWACSARSIDACTALTAASLRFDSGTIASVCLACSIAPDVT
jgi:hypothetical protein